MIRHTALILQFCHSFYWGLRLTGLFFWLSVGLSIFCFLVLSVVIGSVNFGQTVEYVSLFKLLFVRCFSLCVMLYTYAVSMQACGAMVNTIGDEP